MKQGPTEATILEASQKSGMPLPQSIQNAPELALGLQLYYKAFLDLSNSRAMGMVEGPIPWGAIQEYCVFYGLDDETTEDMHFLLGEMDTARAEYLASKQAKG